MAANGIPKKPVPRYRSIYVCLRGRILSGDYTPGNQIETEMQLADEFDTSLITIRQAVQMLDDEGLLDKQQGRGTFVPEAVKRRLRVLAVCGLDFAPAHRRHMSAYHFDLLVWSKNQAAAMGAKLETVWVPTHTPDDMGPYCDEDYLRQHVGFLFIGCGDQHPVLRRVLELKLRYVLISATERKYNNVWLDLRQATQLGLGVFGKDQHIFIFGMDTTEETAEKASADAGFNTTFVDVMKIPNTESIEAGAYHLTLDLIKKGKDVSCMLLLDDVAARGATRALLTAGYGSDDVRLAVVCAKQEMIPLGLPATFVVHDMEEVVVEAFRILKHQSLDHVSKVANYKSGFEILS